MEDLRYPIGTFTFDGAVTEARRQGWIEDIAAAPGHLRAAVRGLDEARLDTPYRPGGWTVRQVVHHLPDSHMNAFVRFKLALTEDGPIIKPYNEARWAELVDSKDTPVAVSLTLLEALHERWVTLLSGMTPGEYARVFQHPEFSAPLTLEKTLAMYSWHGRHHVAHIKSLRDRMGWK